MSMIKDIKTYLTNKGISTPIFLGSIPEGETDCIGLYRYAGKPPLKEAGIERVGLQVRCRAGKYEDAIANCKMVCSSLWEIGDEETIGDLVEIDGIKYARVHPKQSAYSLGSDVDGVCEVVQNFEVDYLG